MKFELLSENELERIDRDSRTILATVGVKIKNEKALQVFNSAGAKVDFEAQMVWIPEKLIEFALSKVSHQFVMWNRSGSESYDLNNGKTYGHNVGGCVRIYDFELSESRDATEKDLIQATGLIDSLENIHVCRPVVYPQEFPAEIRDIHTAATMLQYTNKPYGVSAYSIRNLDYILRLGSLVTGSYEAFLEKPFIWGSVCPASPLNYSESTTAILMKYAEIGLPVAIAPCPVSGGTSPVSLAGTLIQQNAEFLTGLILVQIINPGNQVKYTTRPIPMDMRTGTATFGSVEMGLMSTVIVQLARKYGICSDVYGLGTSTFAFDPQNGFEKSLNALLPVLAGANLIAAAGLMEDALTSSYEQLVIDNAILGNIFRIMRGINVSDETNALDLIQKVGPGGNYLLEDHTRIYARQELFTPKICYRAGNQQYKEKGFKSITDAAHEQVQTILENGTVRVVSEEIAGKIGELLREVNSTIH
ncbi:MAG: trimethylamine methyltransferase family protein [Anaerolineaceae bacterium]